MVSSRLLDRDYHSGSQKASRIATAHEQFAALHASTREQLATLANEWAEGLWSAGGWAERMDEVLLEAHTQAVVIGRTHAGDTAPRDADDRRFAEEVMDGEAEFLSRFRNAMAEGQFHDEEGLPDGEAVARRASSYADRITGTANAAWTSALPADAQVSWILGAEDDSNCEVCPAIADGSPYDADSFDLWPGSNGTPCLQNCRCRLEEEGGQRAFVTPD